MATIIITDVPKDYTSFLSEAINFISENDVKGIALVAVTEEDNLTSYWNMSLRDKERAEMAIRHDVTDQFIMANIDRYKESIEGGEEE